MNTGDLISKLKIFLRGFPCHPLVGRALNAMYKGRIPYGGHTFDLRVGNHVPHQEIARLFWGYYEKSERSLIGRFLRPGAEVIELGSGTGVISCSILGKIGSEGKLLCVEGNPRAIAALRANLARNYPARSAGDVIHAAVDHSDQEEVGYHSDDNILGSLITGSGTAGTSGDRAPALSLARIYKRSGFGSFALVCDIEGAEAGVLQHDAEVLQHCDQMIIELHATTYEDRKYSISNLKSGIERLGFQCVGFRRNVFAFERRSIGQFPH